MLNEFKWDLVISCFAMQDFALKTNDCHVCCIFVVGASASVVSIPPPSSPQAGSKRKKLKAKRDRGSTTPKRSGSPRRLSESELATSPRGGPLSPSTSGSSTSATSRLGNIY